MSDSRKSSESGLVSYKDTRVTFLLDDEVLLSQKDKKKKPKIKVSKSLSCCFHTTKYTFLCCKCSKCTGFSPIDNLFFPVINYRCLILFVFCLIALLVFCLNNWKQLRRMKRVWDAWGYDEEEEEVKKSGGWFGSLG